MKGLDLLIQKYISNGTNFIGLLYDHVTRGQLENTWAETVKG